MSDKKSANSFELDQQMLVVQNLRASHKIVSKLEKSKASTEAMVDRLPDAYFLITKEGRILKGNYIAADMLECDIEDIINKNINDLFCKESWNIFENHLRQFSKLLENSKPNPESDHVAFELQIDHEGKERKHFHWNLRIFEGLSMRRGAIICAFGRDISEIRKFEQQLSQIFSVIPLGITTIDKSGKIKKPYSAYMEYLLNRDSLVNHSFWEEVFVRSEKNLSKAQKMGVEELKEVFDQEDLWFDLCKKRFPTEICLPLDEGNKERWLSLTYHPIIIDGIIKKILIVLNDITEVIQARREKQSKQKNEGVMVQRILDIQNCDPALLKTSFEDFEASFKRLEKAFQEKNERNFCNILHGIKGVARTSGLTKLKIETHEIEDKILEVIAQEKCLEESMFSNYYQELRLEYKELKKLWNMLQKGSDATFLNADIDDQISAIIKDSKKLIAKIKDTSDIKEIKKSFKEIIESLGQLNSTGIDSIETKMNIRAAKTAETLGKKVKILYHWKGVSLPNKHISKFSDILGHIINNAIDHGIELPEIRTEKNKNIQGLIEIYGKHNSRKNQCEFTITDDGAGIDLQQIRNKCLEKKILNKKYLKSMDEFELMQFIFKPGFTTATKLTDISGRGIGLDSVVSMIHELNGGEIEVGKHEPFGTRVTFMIKCN